MNNNKNIKQYIKKKLEKELEIEISKEMEKKTFLELGVDSESAVELINDINREFELEESVSILFKYPSVYELANCLMQKKR
ncbi:MAG: acyl carrier protein [Planctomycetes bacterium]|nr:acyl carrier protein [Planctomycetota bacterium]